MLNKRVDPWETPNKITSHKLYSEFILLWFVVWDLTNNFVPVLISQYWISTHLILKLRGHLRGSQISWNDP